MSLVKSEILGNVEKGYTTTHKLLGAYVDKMESHFQFVPYSELPTDIREEMLYDMNLIELFRDGVSYIPKWLHTTKRYSEEDFTDNVWIHGDGIPVAIRGDMNG